MLKLIKVGARNGLGDDLGKTLIVCEKPSAAVKIASALAARRPRKGDFNGVPYYEFERGGGRMVVVPALGNPQQK